MAVGVTPFLLLFVSRFKRAVKKATHEVRRHQSDIVAVVQQGLESVRVVKAFGRQDLEQQELGEVSHATVDAALKARKVKSLLSPVVTVTVALCTAFVLWRGASLILIGTMTAGALTVFLSYLSKFFKPVQDLAKNDQLHRAGCGGGGSAFKPSSKPTRSFPEHPDAREPDAIHGEIIFDHVAFAYDKDDPVLRDVSFTIKQGELVGIVGPTGGGKSTVVSLVPRFYDPTSGSVSLDAC